jgi:uncharacterized lipoprotein YbaY
MENSYELKQHMAHMQQSLCYHDNQLYCIEHYVHPVQLSTNYNMQVMLTMATHGQDPFQTALG